MSFVPAGLVASLAKQVVNGEGQSVIYRRVTHSINTSTGVATATNADTALRAVVSGREASDPPPKLTATEEQDYVVRLLEAAGTGCTPNELGHEGDRKN